MADVSTIKSFYLRESLQGAPTPLERAQARAAEAQTSNIVAQTSLASGNAVEAQLIAGRFTTDIGTALTNPTRAEAAYEYSIALLRNAYARENPDFDVTV